MDKNTKNINILKRRILRDIFKENKIKSINPEAINSLEKKTIQYIKEIIQNSKENMLISGRRTLLKEDIEKSLEAKEDNFVV